MKVVLIALIAVIAPNFAEAKELVYRIDYKNSKIDQETGEQICGLPDYIRMDDKKDLATEVIGKVFASNLGGSKIQTIQATKGWMGGGNLEEPYQGEYRVRVALLFQSWGYPSDVVSRVQITTFGSTSAPKAFTVDSEYLNYLESAELAEGSICTGFAYTLQ